MRDEFGTHRTQFALRVPSAQLVYETCPARNSQQWEVRRVQFPQGGISHAYSTSIHEVSRHSRSGSGFMQVLLEWTSLGVCPEPDKHSEVHHHTARVGTCGCQQHWAVPSLGLENCCKLCRTGNRRLQPRCEAVCRTHAPGSVRSDTLLGLL